MRPGEFEELLTSLGTCPIQKKGLSWRLFKLYWKKLSFIVLMLILPGGLWILGLCAAVWVLNWGREMQAYQEEQHRRGKEEHGIHS